jgi:hypothetical protein
MMGSLMEPGSMMGSMTGTDLGLGSLMDSMRETEIQSGLQ